MRDVALDDYLLRGPDEALDVIAEITGAHEGQPARAVPGRHADHHAARLPGRATAATTGVSSPATLLNTLVDFSEPGRWAQFPDEESVERLERADAASGLPAASEMPATFDLLRANDLIWNYVVSSWLMGEPPPAFDILAWNADSTRMPADMHSFYLRCCYVENQLARGEMELAGTRLDLAG